MLVLLGGMEGRGVIDVSCVVLRVYTWAKTKERAMDDEGEARRACECYRDSRIVGCEDIVKLYSRRSGG